jgi:N-acyl-D-aspartate/D-glutamate deacylase
MACDVKLSGGWIIDGSGAPRVRGDVALSADRIDAVGDLADLEARETIDCTDRILAPGFIDIHSHADFLVPGADSSARIEPFLRQGMTTLVGGNCGFSPAPVTERNRGAVRESARLITDDPLEPRWTTMAQFLDALDATPLPLHVAELVGHGSVRAAVTGPLVPDAPDAAALRAMERHVKEALDAGCVGVSTGLGYAPGIFAAEQELVAFARWTAERDKLFTSHLRAYSCVSPVYPGDDGAVPHNLRAIDELLRVGRATAVRLQLSHLIFVGRRTWPTWPAALARIDEAHAGGLDVAFDAFPYTAGNTTAAVLFPPELLPQLETILANPEALDAVRQLGHRVFAQIGFFLEDIQIMHANAPDLDRYDGWFVGDAARAEDMEPFAFYGRLVLESHRNARVLNHTYSGHDGDEDALRAVLAHPLCTIETDTFLTPSGHQNPASYGTFPRVLSTYVQAGLFPLEEAVRKMTGAAADRLGLRDRGRIRRGAAADLVVFDAETLRDTASFASPARFPTGIEHVFVGGAHVIDGDRYDAAAGAGRVLRG